MVLVELADRPFEGEVPACRLELLDQVRRALVEDPEPVLDEPEPETCGQVALARSGRAEQEHVCALIEPGVAARQDSHARF